MNATTQPKTVGPDFAILKGCICDIDTLCQIDADASQLFERAGLESNLPADHEFFRTERCRWLDSLASHSALLAVDPEGVVMGFAACGLRDNQPYLDQLSVRTQFMRRGVGTALLTAVQKLAIRRGGQSLWLTTYGHLPWNRPFYERAGFAPMSESTWGPEMLRETRYERHWLPCPEYRIVMRKELPSSNRTKRSLLRWIANS